MSSTQLNDRLLAALEEARSAGSPVVGAEAADRQQMARSAVTRWNSFARRNRKRDGDLFERRVEDLAKGLRSELDARPSLVGPLMGDYRWLARRLAEVLTETTTPSTPTTSDDTDIGG